MGKLESRYVPAYQSNRHCHSSAALVKQMNDQVLCVGMDRLLLEASSSNLLSKLRVLAMTSGPAHQ